jgi:hypothetical protein
MSAGKLFWLCRYGKPTICNDNFSISRIVECNNLGIKAVDSLDFEYLEKNYHDISASCRKFYDASATRAEKVLKQIIDHSL